LSLSCTGRLKGLSPSQHIPALTGLANAAGTYVSRTFRSNQINTPQVTPIPARIHPGKFVRRLFSGVLDGSPFAVLPSCPQIADLTLRAAQEPKSWFQPGTAPVSDIEVDLFAVKVLLHLGDDQKIISWAASVLNTLEPGQIMAPCHLVHVAEQARHLYVSSSPTPSIGALVFKNTHVAVFRISPPACLHHLPRHHHLPRAHHLPRLYHLPIPTCTLRRKRHCATSCLAA
jgi:hypothetical protein